jgi:hypothetical protein
MAIYRLIANGSFGPEEIKAMTAAYEAALLDLGLVDRDDPLTEIVATAIVSIASMGERDPVAVKDRALNAIGARSFNSNAAEIDAPRAKRASAVGTTPGGSFPN